VEEPSPREPLKIEIAKLEGTGKRGTEQALGKGKRLKGEKGTTQTRMCGFCTFHKKKPEKPDFMRFIEIKEQEKPFKDYCTTSLAVAGFPAPKRGQGLLKESAAVCEACYKFIKRKYESSLRMESYTPKKGRRSSTFQDEAHTSSDNPLPIPDFEIGELSTATGHPSNLSEEVKEQEAGPKGTTSEHAQSSTRIEQAKEPEKGTLILKHGLLLTEVNNIHLVCLNTGSLHTKFF
jgi:2-iminoacetate synthase ThiH